MNNVHYLIYIILRYIFKWCGEDYLSRNQVTHRGKETVFHIVDNY